MMTVRILAVGEALQLGGDALDRARGWTLLSNRSPAIRNEVDLLGQREVDGGGEGGELALALGARLLAEVVVAGAEMDVRGMDDP